MDKPVVENSPVQNQPHERTWAEWAGGVAASAYENAKVVAQNPYVDAAIVCGGVVAVGIVTKGKLLGSVERLFPESRALLGDEELAHEIWRGPAASQMMLESDTNAVRLAKIQSVLTQRERALLSGKGSSISPTPSFRATPSDELAKQYNALPERSIDYYTKGGEGYQFSETRPSQPSEGSEEHLKRLTRLLYNRFKAKSDINLLEIAPHTSTDVPRSLEPHLASYTAIDAQRVPLMDQRRFLSDTLIPKVFHARADVARLPFASESHDLVVVSNNNVFVSGDPTEVEKAADEVARVLRPDGEFVLQPWRSKISENTNRWYAEIARQDAILSRFEIVDYEHSRVGAYAVAFKKREPLPE